MIRRTPRVALPLILLAAGGGLVAPRAAQAQIRGNPDFLFRRPAATLSLRLGYARPSENSDVFDQLRSQFTLDRGAFSGVALAADLSVRAAERFDVVLGIGFSRVTKGSKYRNWVDLDDLPIEQTTFLSRLPLSAGVKYYFKDRGRSIGRFAWIPEEWTPYVGAAAGMTHYRLEQLGDFVDVQSLDIYYDALASDGWAPAASILAGVDRSLGPRVALRAEARYSWGSTDLDFDFGGFEPIDLGGLDASIGLAFRF